MHPEEEKARIQVRPVDETLDELFWPVLLLFDIRRTCHSKYCFHIGVGQGGIHSPWKTCGEKAPKEPFPPAPGYLTLGVGGENSGLLLTMYTSYQA